MIIRQVECLHCSNSRSFVMHNEATQRLISQADLHVWPVGARFTCARCGSASLINSWSDGMPYAPERMRPSGQVPRRLAANI